MIVNKIYLENWGIIREPTEIEFSDGLNILYGPNDIGKTTLIDVIRTVFFTKHTSHSEKIRALVPWGSTLSPKATITFCQDGHYRITKRFMSSEMSLLEEQVNGKWARIAEGDSADKKVTELVGGKLPIRGDTRPEFWGIGQALWMVQGEPFISEDLNEETLSSLQKLIGAAIESEQERKIFNRVNQKISSIFTKTKRDFKKDSEIAKLKEGISQLEETKKNADRAKEEKERLIREMDNKEIILQKKRQKLNVYLAEKKDLKEKVEQAHTHKRNREKLEEEIKKINLEYKTLKTQIDNIKEGKEKISDIESENHSLNGEKNRYQDALEELEGKIKKIVEQIENKAQCIEINEDRLQYTRIAYDTMQKERELKEKEQLLNEVEGLEKELSEKQNKILKAPSKQEIKQIDLIHQQIHDLKTKLDAMGLATKIIARSNISGKIHLDEKSREFELKAGEQNAWRSHQTVRIQIDRIGDFEIKSGSEDIREMRTDLEKLEVEYVKSVSPYVTRDIEKLRELSHQKEELDKEIKRLGKELKGRAKGGKEAVNREIAGLKRSIAANWYKIPEDSEPKKYMQFKDKSLAQQELWQEIDGLEINLKNLKKEQKEYNENHSNLEKEKEGIKSSIQKLEKKIHGNSERMKEIIKNLEKLEKDGLNIKEREGKLNQIASQLDQKERAWKEYKSEIAEMEERPFKAWEECETSIERFQKDIKDLEKAIAEMNGKLSTVLSSLKDTNKIEEELEYLKKRERQLLTDAHAVKLLYDLMHFYRDKTIEGLTKPIQKILTEDLKALFGEKYTSIKFDEKIRPVSVEVPTWRTDAPIGDLSFGTKEQIWCLFRLALGKLLSNKQRQLVVLDDPLANTDPGKMYRALQILKDRANELQIIVITCDVDKYNWLSNANFISFESR